MSKCLLQDSLSILNTVIDDYSHEKRPVAQDVNAADMLQKVAVDLHYEGSDINDLQTMAMAYLENNPDVASAKFNKQLYSGLNNAALLGDWITSLSNATMHTYQVSPIATLMELELIKQWNALVGFSHGDGVMVSGGSQANLMSMLLARHKVCPDVKKTGLKKTLVAFVSDQAHYSSLKAVNVLGIGEENLISVATDEQGRMLPEALEQAILESQKQGHTPFYVGLTAGTTVLGAYDPVAPCAEISKRFGLWLHVDGAWGAPILFSAKHRHLLKDTHLADSVAWDAHKLMNVSMTAAVILVKESGFLKEVCSGGGADYLFHSDQNSDFNLGDRSIQCGRRADALKVWMSWKLLGNQGFEQKIDYLQQLKSDFVTMLTNEFDCFELLHQPSYLNILFRYNAAGPMEEVEAKALTVAICRTLKQRDIAFIDHSNCKGKSGIRLILANTEIDIPQLRNLLTQCQEIAQQITA